jgi:nitronate monooxygenase
MASATTVAEARWLEANGCDAIIAQGYEAGGHRGMFLTDNLTTQVGTFALVPQVVDAVKVPVVAAGGITDARGIVAALALGASAVQIGTAYLFCPESRIQPPHRAALASASDDATAVTNLQTETGARPHKPRHARAGTRQRCRAGISAGRRRAGAHLMSRRCRKALAIF